MYNFLLPMLTNISKKSKISASSTKFNNHRYQSSALPPTNHRLKLLLNLTGFNAKVLDLGCGTGFFLKMLLTHNHQVTGLDASSLALSKAKHIPNVKLINCNLESIFPLKDNQFDIVTAGEIIEHIYDTGSFLKEIKRVLKKNGRLIISTPNVASLGRRLMLLLGINPLLETELTDVDAGHVRYFTNKSLFALLEKHGFQVNQHTSDSVNFVNKLDGLNSKILAKMFPSIGGTIIVSCINKK